MKLFISYSREDAGNFAKHIHRFMRNKGHDVFIDVNDIRIGKPWADSIEKNISECDIFVVILTPDSLTSSYVEKEVLQAQKENKIIFPCIHEYVNYNEIKWDLNKIQGIEFSNEYQLVLNLYQRIKNYEDIKKPIDDISEDINALHEKGRSHYMQSRYQEAIEDYDKALKIDPNYTDALYHKGRSLHKLGKYEEAIEWFDKALAIDPNYSLTQSNKKLALECLYKEKPSSNYDNTTSRGTMPKGWKTSSYSEDTTPSSNYDNTTSRGYYAKRLEDFFLFRRHYSFLQL